MSEKVYKYISGIAFGVVTVALALTIYRFVLSQYSLDQYRQSLAEYRNREQQYERAFAESREQVESAIEYNKGIGECLNRQQSSITELRETLSGLREYYTEMENRLSELSSIYSSVDSDSDL